MYRFSAYHFDGLPQAFGDSSISLAYGRKITQRIALQAYGGPDIITYRVPIAGETRRVSGTAGVSMNYGFRQGGISLGYAHGLSAGSGVLVGSETDQVTFSGNRRVSRLWTASANVGFASNRTLDDSSSITHSSYRNAFAGGGISRPFGRNVDFSLSYTANVQSPNVQSCTGPGCNVDYTQHTITVSLQWHTRPFVLE